MTGKPELLHNRVIEWVLVQLQEICPHCPGIRLVRRVFALLSARSSQSVKFKSSVGGLTSASESQVHSTQTHGEAYREIDGEVRKKRVIFNKWPLKSDKL
ncbi:hypothetical protein PILCRDRAFT_423898 [Piloderma croceum F 1598]|uniref:Uncharacterized protein n=1 Tax=Piloderma croceum (strain F 1598) TaxID=765440 RepID=A0A0C3BCI7_PILCF|nr:hypothetical protein PILCRDRAFT_423898 [Piloderma croceum F 1598]